MKTNAAACPPLQHWMPATTLQPVHEPVVSSILSFSREVLQTVMFCGKRETNAEPVRTRGTRRQKKTGCHGRRGGYSSVPQNYEYGIDICEFTRNRNYIATRSCRSGVSHYSRGFKGSTIRELMCNKHSAFSALYVPRCHHNQQVTSVELGPTE